MINDKVAYNGLRLYSQNVILDSTVSTFLYCQPEFARLISKKVLCVGGGQRAQSNSVPEFLHDDQGFLNLDIGPRESRVKRKRHESSLHRRVPFPSMKTLLDTKLRYPLVTLQLMIIYLGKL